MKMALLTSIQHYFYGSWVKEVSFTDDFSSTQ